MGDRKARPSLGLAVFSALSFSALAPESPRALGPAFLAAPPGACVIPSRPTRGLALGLPPSLWPAAPGPFLRGPGRSAWRQHHGGYRDVKRERRRPPRAVRTGPGRAGCPRLPPTALVPTSQFEGATGRIFFFFLGKIPANPRESPRAPREHGKLALHFPAADRVFEGAGGENMQIPYGSGPGNRGVQGSP